MPGGFHFAGSTAVVEADFKTVGPVVSVGQKFLCRPGCVGLGRQASIFPQAREQVDYYLASITPINYFLNYQPIKRAENFYSLAKSSCEL